MKQQDILVFFALERFPKFKDAAHALGMSSSTVWHSVRRLEQVHLVHRHFDDATKWRPALSLMSKFLSSSITCFKPFEFENIRDDNLNLLQIWLNSKRLIALRKLKEEPQPSVPGVP